MQFYQFDDKEKLTFIKRQQFLDVLVEFLVGLSLFFFVPLPLLFYPLPLLLMQCDGHLNDYPSRLILWL